MKKFFKISGIVILVLIILIVLLPIIFKGKIVEQVKKEINRNLNAKVDFTDYSLSLWRSFPNFSLELENLTVVGIDVFEKDTLAVIPSFYLTIDLFAVFGGDSYPIKKINIHKPKILLKVLEDGTANWDIAKEIDEEETEEEITAPSAFRLELQKVVIHDATLIYDDMGLATFVEIKHLDHQLKGDMTADLATLQTKTKIGWFSLDYEGIRYFNKAEVDVLVDLEADMVNDKYSFNKGDIRVNNLFLDTDGYVTLLESGYEMDIVYKARENSFRNFLSLVPAIYAKDFDKVKTEGTLSLNGFVKGIYDDERMPGFGLNIIVDKAKFQYPDLPKAVENIAVNAKIINPDGDPDHTLIDVSVFHFEIDKNSVDLQLSVKTPESDPGIKGHLKGSMDLATLKDAYPLEEGTDLNGLFNADINVEGYLSSIENEQYDKFKALGELTLKNMNYKSKEFPQGMTVKDARFIFSPQFLNLASFDAIIGSSDIKANGKILNYLSYYFSEDLLRGSFSISSQLMDLNEFMTKTEGETTASTSPDTLALSIIEVPGNVDFTMSAAFQKLLYDRLVMQQVSGSLIVRDNQLILKDLRMNTLDGQMTVNGTYSTAEPDKPLVDFNLDIDNIDIQQAAKTFTTMKYIAPIADKTKGRLSTRMTYRTILDDKMMPVLTSMSGAGNLKTTKITVEGIETFNRISDALKIDKFKNMLIDEVNLSFEFIDGKVYTKPFKIKYGGILADVSGSTSFDEKINYIMNMQIPRSEFGSAANNVLDKMVASAGKKGLDIKPGQVVNIDVLVGGTLTDPEIKTGLKGAMDDAVQNIKDRVKDEIDKKKAEAQAIADSLKMEAEKKLKEAEEKAKAEAEKLKKEAEDKAKAEAERLKKEAEEKAKKEEEAAKKKMEEEAKKKLKKLF